MDEIERRVLDGVCLIYNIAPERVLKSNTKRDRTAVAARDTFVFYLRTHLMRQPYHIYRNILGWADLSHRASGTFVSSCLKRHADKTQGILTRTGNGELPL